MFGPLSLVVEIAWDKKQHSFGRCESVSTYQLQCGSKSERQRRYSIKKLQSCALYSVLFDRGHWRKFLLMCYVFFLKIMCDNDDLIQCHTHLFEAFSWCNNSLMILPSENVDFALCAVHGVTCISSHHG